MTYVAELKKLASHCSFVSDQALKDILRDKLICGININDARMQRHLLAELDIEYEQAFTPASNGVGQAESPRHRAKVAPSAALPGTELHRMLAERQQSRQESNSRPCYNSGTSSA